ncbi:aldo/keto reductase [Nocardioides sp. Soil805]|uniref:aldo/keto reductase n=1 Tax=Nocardioides sp. Soil805 TaxID=1736416 RepID=UPI000B10ABAD|nr:aldo/keto reductase [Nocardioides sp. Soil805]
MINDLVLGTMYLGTRTDRATSFALLDRFVEAGGTTIDTANCYAFWASGTGHGGQSEELIGDWLRANPGLRERLVLATKVGVEPLDGGGVEGLGAETVRREAERSRERLGVDRIDLYWAHGEDRGTPIEETTEALGALVAGGTVGRIGISNHPTWLVERSRAHALARGLEPASALQLTTSYVAPRPGAAVEGKDHRFGWVSEETIDYLERNEGIELWAYSPLVQGSYDRDDRPFPQAYDHPGTTARLAALTDVARELDVARSQVVLAWLLHRSPQVRPIVGVSSLDQLEPALAAADLALDADTMARLDQPA